MWIPLVTCLCCLLASSRGQERASFRRGNDQRGRCQYSFTVESPMEASCPAAGGPELEGVKSRLALLEALVGRLTGAGESTQLREEKERLERQVQELQGQLGGLRQEVERLRARPCQTASSAGGSTQDRSQRPPSGECWTYQGHCDQKVPPDRDQGALTTHYKLACAFVEWRPSFTTE